MGKSTEFYLWVGVRKIIFSKTTDIIHQGTKWRGTIVKYLYEWKDIKQTEIIHKTSKKTLFKWKDKGQGKMIEMIYKQTKLLQCKYNFF